MHQRKTVFRLLRSCCKRLAICAVTIVMMLTMEVVLEVVVVVEPVEEEVVAVVAGAAAGETGAGHAAVAEDLVLGHAVGLEVVTAEIMTTGTLEETAVAMMTVGEVAEEEEEEECIPHRHPTIRGDKIAVKGLSLVADHLLHKLAAPVVVLAGEEEEALLLLVPSMAQCVEDRLHLVVGGLEVAHKVQVDGAAVHHHHKADLGLVVVVVQLLVGPSVHNVRFVCRMCVEKTHRHVHLPITSRALDV